MFELSRKNRQKIEKELKDFAFEQSPLFQCDTTQGMEITQHYEITDDWREGSPANTDEEEVSTTHIANEDMTSFELGFEATRIKYSDEKPDYTFAARLIARRVIQPYQLILNEEDWQDISDYYIDEENEGDEEAIKDRGQVIQMLVDDMSRCEQYRRVDYSYDTREATIRVNDENGYLIDGTPFNVIESHPYVSPAMDEVEDKDSQKILDAGNGGDQLLDALQFESATASLRDEYDENGDIMPHEDKVRELRFLINCLKKRIVVIS